MVERISRRTVRLLMAALAALALAGCAADYVGDDWQCPLAQGKVCASVAAADPAVSGTRGTANPVDDVPLYRRIDGRTAAGAPAERVDEPACQSDCGPFAWLAGLFAGPVDSESGEAERTDVARDADIEDTGAAVSQRNGELGTAAAGHFDSADSGAESTVIVAAEPSNAPPSAADDGGTDGASGQAAADALRTDEVVARIWIAPFVDADGIYREGAYVRAVIAPAAWRLP